MKTQHLNNAAVERKWYTIDADGMVLGRLSSEIARILRGKHKAIWSPHVDTGDFVIVVNAEKIILTGGKENKKEYWIQSSHPGSSHHIPYQTMLHKHPTEVIRKAVWGMLPRGALGNRMISKLKLVVGPDASKYTAQKPEVVPVDKFRAIA
ncbi:MAG: 50S ribosomal protein L13 [bacterium]|nr:50S ribosomal protein L13 [bacterium]